jgi:hypothetical protein
MAGTVLAATSWHVERLRADTVGTEASAGTSASTQIQTAVVVEASRLGLEQQVTNFVTTATGRAFEDNPARWHRTVCPLVAGLRRDQGEFVLRRISEIAIAAGAPLGARKCRPNLYIVATQDPRAVLATWRKRAPMLFGDQAPPKIQKFLDAPRPIRVWYNVTSIGADGMPLVKWDGRNINQPSDLGRLPNSRLEHGTVRQLQSVIVIVDAGRVGGMRVANIADYVAMVGLVELQSDRDFTGIPTVLASAGEAAPTAGTSHALTAWDRALLAAVYGTEQKYKMQRAQVVQHMLRDVADLPRDTAAAPPAGN